MQIVFNTSEPTETLIELQVILQHVLTRRANTDLNVPIIPESLRVKPQPAAPMEVKVTEHVGAAAEVEPAKPKRGRPSGSKNQPKDETKAETKLTIPAVPSQNEVRVLLIAAAQRGKSDEAKALLADYGCTKLSQMPLDKLAEFAERVEAL